MTKQEQGHYPEDCHLYPDCDSNIRKEGKSKCCNATITDNGICAACGKFTEVNHDDCCGKVKANCPNSGEEVKKLHLDWSEICSEDDCNKKSLLPNEGYFFGLCIEHTQKSNDSHRRMVESMDRIEKRASATNDMAHLEF